MAELPDLGTHCALSECNQLDFLPSLCYGCMQTFCKFHHAADKHSCTKENLKKVLPKFTGEKSYACELSNCSGAELTPVICEACRKNFCLKHRHQTDHQCSEYQPPQYRMVQTKEHVKAIVEKTELKKTGKGRKSKVTAAKVALMKIKLKAEGEKGLPVEERIYCQIFLPLVNTKQKCAYMFFSDKWSVGKVVDYIAGITKLENRNNVGTAQKLRLFEVETGDAIDFGENVGECVKAGVFYSGSSLIMEYVDNEVLVIDDTSKYKL